MSLCVDIFGTKNSSLENSPLEGAQEKRTSPKYILDSPLYSQKVSVGFIINPSLVLLVSPGCGSDAGPDHRLLSLPYITESPLRLSISQSSINKLAPHQTIACVTIWNVRTTALLTHLVLLQHLVRGMSFSNRLYSHLYIAIHHIYSFFQA